MASYVTGDTRPLGERSLPRSQAGFDYLPVAIALQGLGLFVLGFFLVVPPPEPETTRPVTLGANASPVSTVLDQRFPADLIPERIPLPRFTSLDEPTPLRQPASPRENQTPRSGEALHLTALRVDTVAWDAPVAVQAALALPGAPVELAPGTISLDRFGENTGVPGRRDRGDSGWGGTGGIGGVRIPGVGGGKCRPRPAGDSIVIERRNRLPW